MRSYEWRKVNAEEIPAQNLGRSYSQQLAVLLAPATISPPPFPSPLLSFSFSLSPQFLSDRTKTILPFPPNKISSRLIEVGKERDATFVLALTHMLSIQVAQTKGDGKLIYLVEASYLFPMTRVQGTGLH